MSSDFPVINTVRSEQLTLVLTLPSIQVSGIQQIINIAAQLTSAGGLDCAKSTTVP